VLEEVLNLYGIKIIQVVLANLDLLLITEQGEQHFHIMLTGEVHQLVVIFQQPTLVEHQVEQIPVINQVLVVMQEV
jgi:hypothetical protein